MPAGAPIHSASNPVVRTRWRRISFFRDSQGTSMRFWRWFTAALLTCVTGASGAEYKPLWEPCFGFFLLSSPDYRGSDESRGSLLPFPYIVYRGDILKVDRSGIYSRLFETERGNLDPRAAR